MGWKGGQETEEKKRKRFGREGRRQEKIWYEVVKGGGRSPAVEKRNLKCAPLQYEDSYGDCVDHPRTVSDVSLLA